MKKEKIEKVDIGKSNINFFNNEIVKDVIYIIKKNLVYLFILLSWTFSMLLVMIMIDDLNEGVKIFFEVNSKLYEIYLIIFSINIFLLLVKHIFKNKK